MQLAGKTVLVTGSTTGIGEAIARRCVDAGASVMLHGRRRERGDALAAELGERAACHIDDLADPDAAPRLVAATHAHFGRIDALVNNAALTTRSNLDTTDAAMFDTVMAVNLRAPALLARAALSHLRTAGGIILNIGSINGYCGEANLLAYSMSKGGLMSMSRNLADALGPEGIRVIHLNVGWVLTENEYALKQREGLEADWPHHLPRSIIPSGAMTSPQQVAAVATFWLSDESRPISGTVMDVEQFPVIGRNPPKETV